MTTRDEDIARAIRIRDVTKLVSIFFNQKGAEIKQGFKTETTLWDYKVDCPHIGKDHLNAWAHLAKDVLAFHNHRGGLIFFGYTDDFRFVGATQRLDSKIVNEQLRRFIPDSIYVEFHRECIQPNQRYLGIAVISPSGGPVLKFIADAPDQNGRLLFKRGWSALREGDQSKILEPSDAERLNRQAIRLVSGNKYYADEAFYRIPSADYVSFIEREKACADIEEALSDPRTAVAHVIGIGGVGKTALATWAAIRAYENRQFTFIASCTAKDRELNISGISPLTPEFTSFESILNAISDVLQYPEFKKLEIKDREAKIRELLKDSGGLLYVDNLETVDDSRIIHFLDTLPVGVRALVTSRRLTVRRSVFPITVGPMNPAETNAFVRSLKSLGPCAYVTELRNDQIEKIGTSCDHIPLAMRWVISKSESPADAVIEADAISSSGKRGEELLEFSFRRVFDKMSEKERKIVEVLSLFTQSQPTEVLLIGSGLQLLELQDALVILIDDAIVEKRFDSERNDDCYSLLPITRSFIYGEVGKIDGRESEIRTRLTNYFEARDVKNPDDRSVIREVRQNTVSGASSLVDLAISAKTRGDLNSADELFRQAITRDPRSWQAYRELAELNRHEFKRIGEALRLYEQAASVAPRSGLDRSRIFREWGILLRESGLPNATELSMQKLQIALASQPRDIITITALAQAYERQNAWLKIVEICAPFKKEVHGKSKAKMLPLLLKAYERTGDSLAAIEVRELLGH